MSKYKIHILVCAGTGCSSSESNLVYEMLLDEVSRKGLSGDVQIIRTGCFGFCEKGPIVKVLPDNTFYTHVKPSDAKEIIDEHIIKGGKYIGCFIQILNRENICLIQSIWDFTKSKFV